MPNDSRPDAITRLDAAIRHAIDKIAATDSTIRDVDYADIVGFSSDLMKIVAARDFLRPFDQNN